MIIAGRNDAAGRAADAAAVLPEVKTSSGRSKSLLSMYAEPPSGEIKMEDFETFAIDRLCVLKTIEEQKAKGTKPDGMAAKVKEVESKYIGSTATLSRKVLAEKDRISHYALRLAYCKTDDQRRWYVTHEAALFRHRFEEASQ
eukprot:COSAG01_NODE_8289_length_2841_cov_9.744712_4_plen_142_part_01